MGGLWLLYLALGLLFGAGPGRGAVGPPGTGRRQRSPALRAWAWFELWICLAGLGTVAGRFLGWPGWSARIWPYTLAPLAVAGTLAYCFRRLKTAGMAGRTSSASWPCPRGPRPATALAPHGVQTALAPSGAGHPPDRHRLCAQRALSLAAVGRAPGAAAAPCPQAPLLLRGQRPRLMALTPLFAAYGAVALWALYRQLGITVIGWQGLAFPNPMTSFFYVDGMVLASVAYTFLCHLGIARSRLGQAGHPLARSGGRLLLAASLAWAGVVYLGKRTHGATASDPYAYAQMGVDLAERGTFLHRLSLFEEVMPLDIAWAPLQPVGYHIPRNELGDSPSVWATGASVLLAAGLLAPGRNGSLCHHAHRGPAGPGRHLGAGAGDAAG